MFVSKEALSAVEAVFEKVCMDFHSDHTMLSALFLSCGTCCGSDSPRPVRLFIVPLGLFPGSFPFGKQILLTAQLCR